MVKVIIVGGGFGGVTAAKALRKANLEILLLDKTNHYVFQPLLYQVATASLPASNVSSTFREIFHKQSNLTVLMEEVESVDLENKTVKTVDQQFFIYDYLILATGARHSYFGHAEWEAFAPGLKTVADAERIRELILTAFEKAERNVDSKKTQVYLTFAIIGAGPTGVELAGSIAEFAHHTLVNNFRRIKPEESKIYLIEGENQVLPSYPKELAEKALKYLQNLGVTVLLNTKVTNVSHERITMGDNYLEAATILWAAGNEASSLLKTLHHPLDRQGRVLVKEDLSLENYPDVFVIGDAAAIKNKEGKFLPPIAPVAIQEGKYVANLINKNLAAPNRKPFVYFDKGMVATIGRGRAVVFLNKLSFSGFFAWILWGVLHIFYLINFKNRLMVMIHWIFLYLKGSRANRIIENLNRKI